MRPSPWAILLGRHAYGMDPESETAWCRVFLIAGAFGGFLLGVTICGR